MAPYSLHIFLAILKKNLCCQSCIPLSLKKTVQHSNTLDSWYIQMHLTVCVYVCVREKERARTQIVTYIHHSPTPAVPKGKILPVVCLDADGKKKIKHQEVAHYFLYQLVDDGVETPALS